MGKILTEANKCPICQVHNLIWQDMARIAKIHNMDIPSIDVRGATYTLPTDDKITHGTACWDAPFGDDCGSCLNLIINTEKALIGPNGYCH